MPASGGENVEDAAEHPRVRLVADHVVALVLVEHLRGTIHACALLFDAVEELTDFFLRRLLIVDGVVPRRRAEVAKFEHGAFVVRFTGTDEDVFNFYIAVSDPKAVHVL